MRHAEVDELLASRLKIMRWVVTVLVLVIVGRLYFLQVVSGERYKGDAQANSVKQRRLDAPRGQIFDRDGRLLVGVRRSFDLVLDRERMVDSAAVAAVVKELTGDPVGKTLAYLEKHRHEAKFHPLTLKRDLLFSQVAWVEARRELAPSLSVVSRTLPDHPQGSLAAHVLGYVSAISAKQLKKLDYHVARDLMGHGGIEQTYDRLLTGTPGVVSVVVDNLGREITKTVKKEPLPGANLRLSLHMPTQRAAENALEGRTGAAVLLDVRTGEVLALASAPTFEPSAWAGSITQVRWDQYRNDPAGPLRARAVAATHPPGSVWKPLVAAAALQRGVRKATDKEYCGGVMKVYRRDKHCWKKAGHGSVDMTSALVHSCNIYFYKTAMDLGLEPMWELGDAVGFGRRTGIDLPGERSGILPGTAWKRQKRNEAWYPGDTVNMAIGQGDLLATPLQVAQLAAAIANKGVVYRPRLLLDARDGTKDILLRETQPEKIGQVPFTESTLRFLKRAMRQTVEGGTAKRARIRGLSVAGKTGTAQSFSTPPKDAPPVEAATWRLDHAWFMGFAPVDEPEVAFAVLLEHVGKHGGEVAAPVARVMLESWFAERLAELEG